MEHYTRLFFVLLSPLLIRLTDISREQKTAGVNSFIGDKPTQKTNHFSEK